MSTSRDIVIHGGDYEHTLGLAGSVGGRARLRYEPMRVQDIFVRMLESRAFDL